MNFSELFYPASKCANFSFSGVFAYGESIPAGFERFWNFLDPLHSKNTPNFAQTPGCAPLCLFHTLGQPEKTFFLYNFFQLNCHKRYLRHQIRHKNGVENYIKLWCKTLTLSRKSKKAVFSVFRKKIRTKPWSNLRITATLTTKFFKSSKLRSTG